MHLIGNMLYLWIFGNNVNCSGRLVHHLLSSAGADDALCVAGPNSNPMVGVRGDSVLGLYG
jgi:hypothetical protein